MCYVLRSSAAVAVPAASAGGCRAVRSTARAARTRSLRANAGAAQPIRAAAGHSGACVCGQAGRGRGFVRGRPVWREQTRRRRRGGALWRTIRRSGGDAQRQQHTRLERLNADKPVTHVLK